MSNRLVGALRCVGLFLVLQAGVVGALRAQVTYTVNDASDPGDGDCTDGTCTLRDAITASNASAGVRDSIIFSIAAGPSTISPTSALPDVTDPVAIDGTSDAEGIILDGTSAGDTPGLNLTGGTTRVRGLVIQNFQQAAVRIASGSNLVIESKLGTNFAGTSAAPNQYGVVVVSGTNNIIGGANVLTLISGNTNDGVLLMSGSSATTVRRSFIGSSADGLSAVPNGGSGVRVEGANNVIGMPTGEGNLISGNGGDGVLITGAGATGNVVRNNNYIGPDVGLANRLSNASGVHITSSASGNTVGGSGGGQGNIIAGNNDHGVLIDGGAGGNSVQGNKIGTVDGSTHMGNEKNGVRITGSSSGNSVGGTSAGAKNTIAFQGLAGVAVASGTGNSILGNAIYHNHTVGGMATYLGIDLGDDDVTPNDAGDGDNGANKLQNYPVLSAASDNGSIEGSLNSIANTQYRVEFFANSTPDTFANNLICDASGYGEGEFYLGFQNVTTNGSGDATFSVNYGPLTPGAFVTATATDPGNNTSEFSACQAVEQGADVQVRKSGPTTVAAGTNFDYTVTVKNNGPADATDVDIQDDLPGVVTYVTSSNGGSESGGTVTWPTVSTIASGDSVQYTVTVTAPLSGTFDNVASATAGTSDGDPSNNDGTNPEAKVTTTVTEQADLEVTKSGLTAVTAGAQFTYTIEVTNHGPNAAADVDITDVLPGTVTYVISSDSGNESGGTVTWPTVSSIAVDETVTRTVTVTAPASGTLVNVASATSATEDPDASNNDGTNSGAKVTTTVGESADVVVTKSGPTTVDAGEQLTYTLTATNNGPSTATSVVIKDVLPAGVTFVSASNNGSESSGTVTWPAVNINNGANVNRTVTVTAPGSGTLVNKASATAATADPDVTNNNGTSSNSKVTTTVNEMADLEVAKTGPANVAAGANFDYTVTVTNHGPSAATNVVVEDVLPGAVAYVTSDGGGSESSGTVTWTVASIASGANVTRTVTVTAPVSGTLDNVASASAATTDPDETNNDGTNAGAMVSTTITEPADVQVTKSGPATVTAASDFSYTLTVKNNGPNTATGVVVKDVLPATVTFVSASDNGTEASGTVTWPPISLANGEMVERTVTVTAPSSGSLTNTASATATTPDLNPANNNGTAANAKVQTTVQSFSVTVSPASQTVARGGDATYVVTVTPDAGTFADPVTLSCSSLPAGTSCAFSPTEVTPGVNSAASTLTVSTTASPITPTGVSSFNVVATSGAIVQQSSVGLNVTTDFALGVTPESASVDVGGTPAAFTVTVEDLGIFDEAIAFTCSGLPEGAACAFNPATVTPNGSDTSVQLSVSASASAASAFPGGNGGDGEMPWWFWLGMVLLGLPLVVTRLRARSDESASSTRRRRLSMAVLAIVMGSLAFISACGESTTAPPTDVTKTFTITGTAASAEHSVTATITVHF